MTAVPQTKINELFNEVRATIESTDQSRAFTLRKLLHQVEDLPSFEYCAALKAIIYIGLHKFDDAEKETNKVLSLASAEYASIANICIAYSREGIQTKGQEIAISAAQKFVSLEFQVLAMEYHLKALDLNMANIQEKKVSSSEHQLTQGLLQEFNELQDRLKSLEEALEHAGISAESLHDMYQAASSIPEQVLALSSAKNLQFFESDKSLVLTISVYQRAAERISEWNSDLVDQLIELDNFDPNLIVLFDVEDEQSGLLKSV